MADRGGAYTDAKTRETKRRLDEVYGQALKDLQAKEDDFWRRHALKDAMYRQKVADGKMSQADYEAWMRGQVFQGKQWRAKVKQITKTLVDADKQAYKIINGQKMDIFAENANYIAYSIEKDYGMDLGFGLYDANSVARLIRDEPKLLPAVKNKEVDEQADSEWYNKIVSNSVTQGILQGEGIGQIAQRIMRTCTDRAENAAVRDARTAYTGAQNAGRIEGLHQAEELGINVLKKWMCTFDFKTRDAHRELDGQTQKPDDPFVVDGDEIMYPGDPHAEPALVWNCRCTLVYEYPKYQPHSANIPRRDNITGEDVGAMTYREWYEMKAAQGATDDDRTWNGTASEQPISEQKTINEKLGDAYEYHRIKHGLSSVEYDPNSEYQFIQVDLSSLDKDSKDTAERTIGELSSKYDTTLQTVRMMNEDDFARDKTCLRAYAYVRHDYRLDNSEMVINAYFCGDYQKYIDKLTKLREAGYIPQIPDEYLPRYVYTHEFGHSLINTRIPLDKKTNFVNADYEGIERIRGRITEVYDEYARKIGELEGKVKALTDELNETFDFSLGDDIKRAEDELKRIRLSQYSLTNADEFFAESFVYTEYGGTGNPYAMKIREIIDEEFRR